MSRDVLIDPDWAWRPYRPTDECPWDRRRITHLYRRAGFAIHSDAVNQNLQRDPDEVVERLVADSLDPSAERFDQLADTLLASGDPRQLAAWWVYTMLYGSQPLLQKMTLFWHGHFATSAEKVKDAAAMLRQHRLFRKHALGSFRELTQQVSRDPAMLIYLDSAVNRKSHPNENFARELMELFCLGEGNYTERDIQELARCFTGWEIRQGRFHFNRYQHDSGEKTFLGQSARFPNGEAIDVVVDHPATAGFVVGKLIRFFVSDEGLERPELAAPLAEELRSKDWDISHVLRRIFKSELFFSEFAIGRKIRSPVDLLLGLLVALEGTTNTRKLADDLEQLGQGLFYPPNVKGWDGGRAWINASRLLDRANAIGRVLRDESTRFGQTSLSDYCLAQGWQSPAELVDQMAELWLAVPLRSATREKLIQLGSQSTQSPNQRAISLAHALCSTPEFHLC